MQPDLDAFFDQLCSRYAWDFGALLVGPGWGSGLVCGSNPPYGPTDFFAIYPKFFGQPAQFQGSGTQGLATVTGLDTTSLSPGQLVTGSGVVPAGTIIQSVDSMTQVTLSQAVTAATGPITLNIYSSPLLPAAVVAVYIALATASLMQARWQDAWTLGMALYIAHFCTLWLRSEGNANCTPGAAAAAGLARGITVSKSAGGISQGVQLVQGLEAWGSWNETEYGVQLASLGKVIGMGPIYVY